MTGGRDTTGDRGRPLSKSSALAEQRTSLALSRTRLAGDRTLMAWVRTSLSLISFGFTFVKFFQYLGKTAPAKVPWSPHGPRNVGLALVGLGTLMILVAAVQNLRVRRQLRRPGERGVLFSGAQLVAVAIGAIGILAVADLLFRAGFF